MANDQSRVPFQGQQPPDMAGDLVIQNMIPDDEDLWVPQAPDVWMRPLCLNVSHGYYVNLLRVRKSGVLSRHKHAGPVHAHVLRGEWHYLEHDWQATEGAYVFEPPGETHTLVVPDHVDEMITQFHVTGALIYVDPQGETTGHEDVFTKIELCRNHFRNTKYGIEFVDTFIR